LLIGLQNENIHTQILIPNNNIGIGCIACYVYVCITQPIHVKQNVGFILNKGCFVIRVSLRILVYITV